MMILSITELGIVLEDLHGERRMHVGYIEDNELGFSMISVLVYGT